VLFVLPLLAVFCAGCKFVEDDGIFEPQLPGTLYNSNDGTCAISGRSLDFYSDSEFLASVPAGDSAQVFESPGVHRFEAFLSDTGEKIAESEFSIDMPNWWVWSGCADGTHP